MRRLRLPLALKPLALKRTPRPHGGEGGMIKRLRRRFVIVVMALVGLLMLSIVAISMANAQSSFDQFVSRSLDRMLKEWPTPGDDGMDTGMGHLPVLWVDLSDDNVVLSSNESQFSIDVDELAAAMTDAMTSSKMEGRLSSYHLTWKMTQTSSGWRIAIADTSSVDAARRAQLANDIKLAVVGMLVLLAITLALSHWALAPVEKAWKQQHQFVADASHELKTPLAVILANTQILRSEQSDIPAESRRWIDSTAEEAERIKGLVEGLLELARTEEGAGSARRDVDVDLSGTVGGEALQFDAVAFERGCTIDSDVAEGLHVMGDPDQLERLVKALLDNACKYAAADTQVKVRLARQGSVAEYSVTNQGTPIDAKDLPQVFDRFYRSDKARARSTGGFGLGLAIAKGIAESHGGKISVTSSEADGTRFCVRLPLKAGA